MQRATSAQGDINVDNLYCGALTNPDGDVVVAYGAAGYKGRGSAVSWWRTHPAAEPTAHRVRELPCLTPHGRASRESP